MTILDSGNKLTQLTAIEPVKKIDNHPKESVYKQVGIKIFLAVILQVFVLMGFAAKRAYTLNTGTIVTLQAQTFDPFDPFRGDYINLRYDISAMPKITLDDYKHNDEIYAVLQKHSPFWTLVSLSREKPELADSEIMLKGKVGYPGNIKYGIEQFFVPEGNGKVLQQSKHLKVEVAIDNTGCAMVKSVAPE
jgi:uncharacterized membrane-anchored protein